MLPLHTLLMAVAVALGPQPPAADLWTAPSFSADSATLRLLVDSVQPDARAEATILLNDLQFSFDESGRLVEKRHQVYRIESQQGVEDWAEVSGRWEAWHQSRPEIRARVISVEGAVYWLDPRTLSEIPIHDSDSAVYSDERRFGGPLPAVAPGAIVEAEVIIRDTAPVLTAGNVYRWNLGWDVPVHKTHVVLSHPLSLPLKYEIHLLPNVRVSRRVDKDRESISIDQDEMPAYAGNVDHVPADLVLFPEIEFSTGTSWKSVASAYARISENKLGSPDPLMNGANLRQKKGEFRNDAIRRILAALHANVRYTGIEFGEASLIPQSPSETLKRRYGDCKDKATLLVAMLRNAGIPAQLALLNIGPGRDINPNLPGMGMFDHVIVYVPASNRDRELWIDATAQYSQVGSLPRTDYGRWALIVGENTESLRRIPEITASQNENWQFRDFTLAEYGPARIVETDDADGPEEAAYREYYGTDSEQVREESESYIKDMYLADSLTALVHTNLSNLDEPATIRFVTLGKRGNTDLTTARATIVMDTLFDRLPKYFRLRGDDDPEDSTDSTARPSRTVDWWVSPFVTEWRYRITAPMGFKLRKLPPDRCDRISTLTLTQNYSSNSAGTVVEAVLRLENLNGRLSVQQAKTLREAVLKAREADPISITFDLVGHSLIAEGKIREGLAAYRELAAQHPREALHKVQLAQALLSLGLGEEARAVAQEATRLEPESGLAFTTLAMVLKRDLVGRPLSKGMDYEGAIAAYKRAIELDPKDKESRANLGLLLEYDPEGKRYGEKARVLEAANVFRGLKAVDSDFGRNFDDLILYDLWYAGKFKDVADYASTLPGDDVRLALKLAATAAQSGADAAIQQSIDITADDETRSRALLRSATALLRLQRYQEASAMLAEGARGQSNESELVRRAAILAKTKPYESIRNGPDDPRSVVQELLVGALSGHMTLPRLRSLLSADATEGQSTSGQELFRQITRAVRLQLGDEALPSRVVTDIALSHVRYKLEGDDSLGYRILVEVPGLPAQHIYVVRDGKEYKVANYVSSSLPSDLGSLALHEIEQGKLSIAKNWLDRAREEIRVVDSDDPLAGPLFAYFWKKGQTANTATIRTAALLLLAPEKLTRSSLSQLDRARISAGTQLDRARLTVAACLAYSAQAQWSKMLALALELTKSFPTSDRAFELTATAYGKLSRFDSWEMLAKTRMKTQPDDLTNLRSLAELAAYRRQFQRSRTVMMTLVDSGKATPDELISYSWYALLSGGPIGEDAIDTALRANDLTGNSNFEMLNTLGCVYAAAGKTREAREILFKSIDSLDADELNPEAWFGFGLIAEQYGDAEGAKTMYSRVEKSVDFSPIGSYILAQQHLAKLRRVPSEAPQIASR